MMHGKNDLFNFLDPDAPHPDNPYRREWKHWLVCNIPGCSVGKGEPLAQFIPSGPPKGGPHRYTFIGKGSQVLSNELTLYFSEYSELCT